MAKVKVTFRPGDRVRVTTFGWEDAEGAILHRASSTYDMWAVTLDDDPGSKYWFHARELVPEDSFVAWIREVRR